MGISNMLMRNLVNNARQSHPLEYARPEISTWKPAKDIDSLHGSECRAFEAAMWEGWPVLQRRRRRVVRVLATRDQQDER